MQRRRFIRGLLRTSALASAVATLALSTPLAQAQAAWPAKPVRIVVAGPAGGSADIVARVLADMLTKQTG
jgi:tripartite-type tricarboxylate transporter receptor subunit TctC